MYIFLVASERTKIIASCACGNFPPLLPTEDPPLPAFIDRPAADY